MIDQSTAKLGRYRLLTPTLKAYLLGLLSCATPPLLTLLISLLRGSVSPYQAFIHACRVVRRYLSPFQIPSCFAVIVAGATVIPTVFWRLVSRLKHAPLRRTNASSSVEVDVVVQFLSTFAAALASFVLFRKVKTSAFHNESLSGSLSTSYWTSKLYATSARPHRRRSSVALAAPDDITRDSTHFSEGWQNETLDYTMFSVVRALDILITTAWHRHPAHSWRSQKIRQFRNTVETSAISTMFAASSSMIMWAWFYYPDHLPKAYNAWISSAARIDARLIEMLRQCRNGNFVYGKDTGLAPVLQSMCRDLRCPLDWGDPANTIPIPCELYHSGSGPSCEWHAIERFVHSWRFAMRMYLPLNLIMLLRRKTTKRSMIKAVLASSRSSAFLAAFTALFYYGVCCARTRLGPKLFSKNLITPTMWDGGLCVGAGCFLCGWSILLEEPSRRQEIAFFVAPRAAATLFSRQYNQKYVWREQLAFAVSVAIILTTAQTQPEKVRGVFGRLLQQLLT